LKESLNHENYQRMKGKSRLISAEIYYEFCPEQVLGLRIISLSLVHTKSFVIDRTEALR
jgi:hypothetical protein